MAACPIYDHNTTDPGIYRNDDRLLLPGATVTAAYAYIVISPTGDRTGHTNREAARAKWRVEKNRKPPRTVAASSSVSTAGRPASQRVVVPQQRPVDHKRRKKPKNPDMLRLPPSEYQQVSDHFGKTTGKCRDVKHVCSRCGWIIRTACKASPPGTIVHQKRWDKTEKRFVRCGGRFVPTE